MTHPSHDLGSETGWCINCGTVHADHPAAAFPCVPSADDQYGGPEADAKAEEIYAKLGTEAETLKETVWLLRYTTVKHGQWEVF